MREWLVIESTMKRAVFAGPDAEKVHYIPRDVAEKLLCRDLGGMVWFNREESELLASAPEWSDALPDWSPLGFWGDNGPEATTVAKGDGND